VPQGATAGTADQSPGTKEPGDLWAPVLRIFRKPVQFGKAESAHGLAINTDDAIDLSLEKPKWNVAIYKNTADGGGMGGENYTTDFASGDSRLGDLRMDLRRNPSGDCEVRLRVRARGHDMLSPREQPHERFKRLARLRQRPRQVAWIAEGLGHVRRPERLNDCGHLRIG